MKIFGVGVNEFSLHLLVPVSEQKLWVFSWRLFQCWAGGRAGGSSSPHQPLNSLWAKKEGKK